MLSIHDRKRLDLEHNNDIGGQIRQESEFFVENYVTKTEDRLTCRSWLCVVVTPKKRLTGSLDF